MKLVCVAYGANPPDPAEAAFNKRVAEDVRVALSELGWVTTLAGLNSDSTLKIREQAVFNLCDGDECDRFGLVSFARELEARGKEYTGSHHKVLALGKDKALAWLVSASVPQSWDHPPEGYDYIAKPRSAHGSLLISESNINGAEEDFPANEYFFQEYLMGYELTACFLGNTFLGLTVVRESGIVSRDDKWDEVRLQKRKPKVWDHSGMSFPAAKEAACRAWEELLQHGFGLGGGGEPYGRVDLRLDARGLPHIIDLNPNAYLGQDGNFYSCWASRGGTFRVLLRELTAKL